MRKLWWVASLLVLVAAALGWRWPYLQLARAEAALSTSPAPHSLYWPGYEPGPSPITLPEQVEALASLAGAIESAESRLGPTPRSLYLRGRLASQRGATGEAIRLLRLAALLDSDDASLQMAYGVGLAIRAASENRAIDWATAANVLIEASERPGFPPLGYANLAEVSEQLPAPHSALEYWKNAASTADSAMRPAFQQRVQQAGAEARTRLQRVARVVAGRQPSRDVSGSAELLLQLALTDWLPRRAEFAADLTRVAEYLGTQQTDPMLRDLLRPAPLPAADQALSRATQANVTGDYQVAAEAGLEAGKLYAGAGNLAGQVLAGVQASLGLRRTSRAAECRAIAEDARRLTKNHGYRWAALRAEHEALACRARQQNGDLQAEREELAARSQTSGFLDVELRAESSLVEPSRGFTAPVESWERAQRGLAGYWRSTLPAPFAVNFYSPLGLMAESFGYSRLASLLFREAMAAMESSPNQWLREAIRADFFRLDPSAQLPGPVTSEIEAASRDLLAGLGKQALARLQGVIKGAAFPYRELDHYDRLALLPVMGRVLWQQGDRSAAMRHYRALLDETVARVSALKGRRQRYSTTVAVGPAWRLLTDAQMETEGGSAALRTWQTFRTLPNPGQSVNLSAPPGEVRLAVALLPMGPVVWFADAQGIAVKRIARSDLVRRCDRFAALVATADSPLPAVNESARELYDLLVQPFEARLAGAHTLVIDADGPLSMLPWGALRDGRGRSLLSRLAIVQTTGWGSPAVRQPATEWQPALVVAEPSVDPRDRARFPVLMAARSEAERLLQVFPKNLYLSGTSASVGALQSELGRYHLFHFAGHGVTNGGNGALVLAGEPPGGTRLITATEIAALDLRQLHLATLAACSSGAGEDRGAVNVESLVQAFLDAGTSQVLAARWNVDSEATSQVMQGFYAGLRQGIAPAAALRASALLVERNPQQHHPYYWAAFQLFGQP